MRRYHRVLRAHAYDFWLARGAVAVIVALQFLQINDLQIGPRWLAPIVEIALLVPLSIATAWTHHRVRHAKTDDHWRLVYRQRRAIRWLALLLTAVVSFVNFGQLIFLVRALLGGHAGSGPTLLLDAMNIWVTNLIAFALWFWNIDRGGPTTHDLAAGRKPDFLFPQMLKDISSGNGEWSPGFIDYIYLSFTNATAFSPADTMPLTQRAKLLMMLEASVSLLTIALVAARAVNILA